MLTASPPAPFLRTPDTRPQRAGSAAARQGERIGVVLFNMGGPETLEDVEPFLVRLFSDRAIIELPLGAWLQPAFARLLARARGPSVRRNYASIGGGSPQRRLTEAQAAALQARLNGRWSRGDAFEVVVAMRYAEPSPEAALERLAAAGVTRIVTLPLYPHWSRATTGSSQADFARALAAPRWRPFGFDVTGVDHYPDDPGYLDAFAETIRACLDGFPAGARHRVVLLFSAHGLPQKFVDAGDPYVDQIEHTRQGLLDRLRLPNRQLLGYQSRTGPVRWIGPGTEELIERLGREGVRELLVIPLSFVSDHIETLYEVDLLFGDLARKAGIADYRRPDALNLHPMFIEALAGLIEGHLADGDGP